MCAYLHCSHAPEGHSFQNLFFFTTVGVTRVKRLPALHYSVIYIFWSFVIIEPIPIFLKNDLMATDEA